VGIVSIDNQAKGCLVDDVSSDSLSEYKCGKSRVRT
ncbi:uncharacterized protein METZ01_LOCUS305675, partial [marine metagenome]